MNRDGRIVILTGAGISAESGIKTFRGADGLWEDHKIEDVASPEGFERNPELVQRFYNERRNKLKEVKPNAAHEALARLEREWDGEVLVVTQNVDDLHERGGSKNLLHMHGELLQVRCRHSDKVHRWEKEVTSKTSCPCCGKPGTLRPNIVWFGEMPFFMDQIEKALWACDLFISIGTSGQVYPASGFILQVRSMHKAKAVELNLEPSAGSKLFDEARHGPATEVVSAFVEELLNPKV